MNFLAHSYLCFSDEQLVGQFLQDFIRNRDRFSFPDAIQQGITLHREIDTFTDAHPAVHLAKDSFRPIVGLYAGAFVDVAFDYFLANSMDNSILKAHSQHVYQVLRNHQEILPTGLQRMLFYMEKDNWLYNYRYDWGIDFSMKNVLRKAKYLDEGLSVLSAFLENKTFLQLQFQLFFPELQKHCRLINSSFQA